MMISLMRMRIRLYNRAIYGNFTLIKSFIIAIIRYLPCIVGHRSMRSNFMMTYKIIRFS
uniref:Uncharacterized protein n=1 Tax=Solanum lycopersicum TaxID=4081 RepID=A0A3Q7GZ73_SOLLC